ncbi:hypothetical protein CASFOL_021375 [Castilleja foliolosa]|uniref:SKP1-like protein n=1 Tax=Castilleja foliolosa TaxID=1961234 RepID=A0ABD3CYD0_9LAMI
MSSSVSTIEEKKIVLRSSDGEVFEVAEAVAVESQTIKHMIEDDCAYAEIPIHNVTGVILSKVIEYCKRHVDACAPISTANTDDKPSSTPVSDDELKAFDADFVKVDLSTLFDIILAANYLNIKSLQDLGCQTVADMIKGKTPEEIRKHFNIKNDFTPEEEEEVRKENELLLRRKNRFPKSSESAVENITKNIVLRSSDGELFEVAEAVAVKSQTIKHMIEDDCAYTVIPIHNVSGVILSKVIEYCKRHVDASASNAEDKPSSTPVSDDELKAFDADFVKVDQSTLFDLILAANYLNIKSLQDLGCQTVADMIKGKTPEEIRKHFNIKNDFTPEEEEEVRRENEWALKRSAKRTSGL